MIRFAARRARSNRGFITSPERKHEPREALPVCVEVLDRTGGYARGHCGTRHRRRDLGEQTRVERPRNQHVGTEPGRLAAVRGGHQVGRLPPREFSERVDARELHRLVDVGCAGVECSAEDERKAQNVIDLVRIVGAAGRDDGVAARLACDLGQDFGHRVREREDERVLGHALDVPRLEHPGSGKAEKDVRAADDVGQGARVGIHRVARLPAVHLLFAAGVDHTCDVGDDDVLAFQSHGAEQVEAGERRRAGARRNEADLFDGLAHELESVAHRRSDDDRGAVLVVVQHRDAHPLAAAAIRSRSTPAP